MSDERTAVTHLLLGIEELLRAAAEAAAALRARTVTTPGAERPSERTEEMFDSIRATLEREIARWDLRGDDDPAARRVRDLFEAILDVMQPRHGAGANAPPSSDDRMRKPGTRAPRRGVQR